MAEAGNLPVQLTSFIGRDSEIEAARRMLTERRLVMFTGSGGCGKTRLALQVATTMRDSYPDGVWWVDLAPLADGTLAPATLAEVLGVVESPVEPLTETVVGYLAGRTALLILDNCEHLIDSCAALAARIVFGCPTATVLATSREPLGVPGEAVWQVPPLGLPSAESVEAIGACDAARLFVDRARASRPSFSVTHENAAAVAEICTRLDGIPLAIELAAARARVLSAEEIAAGLADRFHLLTGGARWALPRQRTLQASMDWSHDLLDHTERAVVRRLAVFAGSFTLDAAEAVGAGNDVTSRQVLDRLSGLVDRSLVHVVDHVGGRTRYRLLETIRAYARDKLVAAGEHEATRRRHIDFYVSFAQEAEAGLEGPESVRWLERVDDEIDEIRVALDWSTDTGDPEQGVRLMAQLSLYWFARRDLAIGRARLEAAVGLARDGTADRARALSALSIVCYFAGDMISSAHHGDEAIDIGRRLGDASALGRALHWRAYARCWGEADRRRAWSDFEEAASLLRQTDDRLFQALNLSLLAWSYADTSVSARAGPLLHEAFAITEAADIPNARCYCLVVRGYVAMIDGGLDIAAPLLEEALSLARDIGDQYAETFARGFLGLTYLSRGSYADTRRLCEHGLAAALDNRNPMGEGLMRMVLGQLAFAGSDLETAADQLDASFRLFARLWQGAAAACRASQAEVALARSRHTQAHEYAADALRLSHETDTVVASARALGVQASLVQLDGDAHRAEDLLVDALDLVDKTGHRLLMGEFLDALVAALADQCRLEEAAQLLGAIHRMRDTVGSTRFPVHEASHETCTDLVRQALGGDHFDEVWAAGAALTVDDALASARRSRGQRKRPSQGWGSLTAAEVQIVELVAEGLTNPQIGERLFVSRRTVQAHLAHVFTKLGVSTRAELAAKATARRSAES